MTQFPTWPHLENLDRILSEYDPTFLSDVSSLTTFTVTEKVHGFNARFGKTREGLRWVGSRNQVVEQGDPASWDVNALQGFVGFAAQHVDTLDRGEVAFGEWAGKGIQKGIDYGDKDFWMFGSMWEEQPDRYILDGWGTTTILAEELGVKTVPVIGRWHGEAPPIEALIAERDAKSLIAEQTREGIVIYRDPAPFNGHGPLIAKFKSARFNEVAKAPKAAKDLPDLGEAYELAYRYATPQRLEHVLQQVAEENAIDVAVNGQWQQINPLLPEYTGHVMRGMHNDIVREAGSEYEALSDESKKSFGKVLNPMVKRLLEDARTQALVAA